MTAGQEPPKTTSEGSSALWAAKSYADGILWLIATGATLAALVDNSGGIDGFLILVGMFGWWCCVSMFPAWGVMTGIAAIFKYGFKRDLTADASFAVFAGAVLIITVLLFRASSGGTDEMEAFGRWVFGLSGVAVLILPVAVWLYQKGSEPEEPRQGPG